MDSIIPNDKFRCPFAIQWSIPEDRLKELKDEPGCELISKNFKISNTPGAKYFIGIYPNDDEHLGETWIYFFKKNGDIVVGEAEYTVKIESANFVSQENSLVEDLYWETRCCTTEELFDSEKGFIVDGKMTIKIDGFFMAAKEMPDEIGSFDADSNALCLALWKREEDKDFTVVADGKEIIAHKNVLAALSPVFAKMFESGMKEAKEKKVLITDFSFDIVEKAVKICYHQSLIPHTSLEEKMQLLQFFDKYDIQAFKDGLEKYLISVINELTVCRLTNAALISNARKLEMKCTEFLRDCMKTKPVLDLDLLDKDFVVNLFKNFFCHETSISD